MMSEMHGCHGQLGKLPTLLDRFATITLRTWYCFGIRQEVSWTTDNGERRKQLISFLPWNSLVAHE